MNGSTSSEGSTASLQKQMQAYDRLPSAIREALANADDNYATYPLWLRLSRNRRSFGGRYSDEIIVGSVVSDIKLSDHVRRQKTRRA